MEASDGLVIIHELKREREREREINIAVKWCIMFHVRMNFFTVRLRACSHFACFLICTSQSEAEYFNHPQEEIS